MNRKDLKNLKELDPCPAGLKWARSQKSIQDAWANCDRTDWMLWALGHARNIDGPRARMAIAFASRTLKYLKKGSDERELCQRALKQARDNLNPKKKDRSKTKLLEKEIERVANDMEWSNYVALRSALMALRTYAVQAGEYALWANEANATPINITKERKAHADIIRKHLPVFPE